MTQQNRSEVAWVATLGETVTGWIQELGAVTIFLVRAFLMIFRPRQLPRIVEQVYFIGAKSTSIVVLVGLFTGMVLGLQLYYALAKFGSEGVLGITISLTLIRELGPVLAAIMITARAGSSMVTEIGIQRISEQIDALSTMRIDPMGFLISPRIAAAIISFPLLTTLFDLVGILGGYISAVLLLGLNAGTYLHGVQSGVEMADITGGFIKSVVFAIIVSTICCFHGYFTHMRKDSYGAKAVGLSTTSAVVLSCIFILVSDYIVTSMLM
ncbi:MAG: ABC transporter permease [Deltaproteobacteria bacterium]|nr:ABC transporter permease [Deltaproteobacteria bacterium]